MTDQDSTIAIIGAGTMGYQLSIQFAATGTTVHLYDRSEQALANGIEQVRTQVPALKNAGYFPSADEAEIVANVQAYSTLANAVHGCWLVIEAIPERLDFKRPLFQELSSLVDEQVVLATNSSSFKSRLLADSTAHPERLMNTHFYNFPWQRSGCEIMSCGETKPALMQQVSTFFDQSGFVPVIVQGESTGFVYNRIWRAIKKESLKVVAEGLAEPEDIDRLYCLATGSQKGPFALMDQVGLDVVLDIERHYAAESGDPGDVPPPFIEQMVEENRLGRKTGRGFYEYPNPPFEAEGWPRRKRT